LKEDEEGEGRRKRDRKKLENKNNIRASKTDRQSDR
jgi:hypothetical protein